MKYSSSCWQFAELKGLEVVFIFPTSFPGNVPYPFSASAILTSLLFFKHSRLDLMVGVLCPCWDCSSLRYLPAHSLIFFKSSPMSPSEQGLPWPLCIKLHLLIHMPYSALMLFSIVLIILLVYCRINSFIIFLVDILSPLTKI